MNEFGNGTIIDYSNAFYWTDIQYPALNGDSIFVPYMTYVQLYNSNGDEVFYADNDCPDPSDCYLPGWCVNIGKDFNNVYAVYNIEGTTASSITDTQSMFHDYMNCINTSGNTEQFCAA